MTNPKFPNRNEAGLYQIGKDIANLEAKIELLEKIKGGGGGGIDVLKVIVPAAKDEDFNNGALCTVELPEDFQNSLVLMFMNGSWIYISAETELGIPLSSYETEISIIKLTDFKNPKETINAEIRKARNGSRPSDA
ncbi:MAG: hypothetical protein KH943_02245 [Haemophilus parahaemolyticus]|uniref:hypothetical protein n=1 Tax=Haemophilus parahaemolyticus TaxID=735 RepID=UPI0026F0E2CB|nr:hypothetical protein [Haemophilus parahaemolyticus]MBS6008615.1 hypothetical protein [Haemophilus parahaemolyticus]